MRIFLALCLVVSMSGIAMAKTHDFIELTVSPVFNISVNIIADTTDYGSMDTGSSRTLDCGQIINDGNVSTYFTQQAAASSWTLDVDGQPGEDSFSLLAITTTTDQEPHFEGGGTWADSIMDLGTNQSDAYLTAGYLALTEGSGSNTSGSYDKDTTRDLWVSIMMPSNLTVGGIQTLTLSVRAQVAAP